MANDRIAYFGWLKLGDVVRGPEGLNLQGDDPQIVATLGSTKPTIVDGGGRSHYEHVVTAHLIRNQPSETPDAFFLRKLAFLTNLRAAMGWGSVYSSAKVLAITSNNGTNFYASTGSVSAGSNVTIPINPSSITISGTQYWFITDGSSKYEVFIPTTGAHTNGLQATSLVNNYGSGAVVFKPLWGLPTARLLHGIEIERGEPSVHAVARNIDLRFICVDDPVTNAP